MSPNLPKPSIRALNVNVLGAVPESSRLPGSAAVPPTATGAICAEAFVAAAAATAAVAEKGCQRRRRG